ncbi:SAM-dependent methyltransferase [Nostoc minutum NIES-26]|uniref:SAM-dependent methyltransferase n=1 Tax=Nostoc minutum NIES-26 TaxID=1844469 RepID=A0A367RTK2_9NOSO|nr:SAM-dependent methyltransferase [Nostoc minutum NIES-26]
MTSQDARQYAAATERNREPILEILLNVLPHSGTILEIASGTGEHAVYFADKFKDCGWLPTDVNPQARASIVAWTKHYGCKNVYPPLELDATESVWIVENQTATGLLNNSPIVAIININMIHISPWSACLGLMAGAGRILPVGGVLYLYGPFKVDGEHTAASNVAFDEYLRAQNREWEVRNLDDVIAAAKAEHLTLKQTYQMSANNLSVVFERTAKKI